MNENKLGGLVRTFGTAEIVNAQIYDQGVIVTLRERSHAIYACNPPRPIPDRVWREVFRYENGELRKVASQDGIHKPASYQPEELIFANTNLEPRRGESLSP